MNTLQSGNSCNTGAHLCLLNPALPKLPWPQSPFVLPVTFGDSKTHFRKLSCGVFHSTPFPVTVQLSQCPFVWNSFYTVSLLCSYCFYHHSPVPHHPTIKEALTIVLPPSKLSRCSRNHTSLQTRCTHFTLVPHTPSMISAGYEVLTDLKNYLNNFCDTALSLVTHYLLFTNRNILSEMLDFSSKLLQQ